MTTTKGTRGKPKMIEIPQAIVKRTTLALHVLEGIPDEKLRAVATLAPGERLRGILEDGSTWEASSAPRERARPPASAVVERAQARLHLLIGRLRAAKSAAGPVSIGAADAAALYDVAFAASEDLSGLLVAMDDGREGA